MSSILTRFAKGIGLALGATVIVIVGITLFVVVSAKDAIQMDLASCKTVIADMDSTDSTLRELSRSKIDVVVRSKLGVSKGSIVDRETYSANIRALSQLCDEHPTLTVLKLGYVFIGVNDSR
jgi:hypothetical protein